MTAHAKLSASGSKKWLTCAPSANLEATFPDERSEYAAEGTFAHEVFELRMLQALGTVTPQELEDQLEKLQADPLYSPGLDDHVQAAVSVARAHLTDDFFAGVEQRVDFSRWVPEGFGTADLILVTGGDTIHVMDLKYGQGVPVDAEGNSQMRLYALGAVEALGHLYEFKTVRMTILQPRLNSYPTEELSADELLNWGEHFVKPRAMKAWLGEGNFVPGEHCTSGFCRARFQCKARADQALELAKQDFALQPPELLTDDQIRKVLAIGDEVARWISDVQCYALQEAERGKAWAGFKLVEGRSNRKYSDQDAVAQRLTQAGIPEAVIYERSLLGITAMEKAIGKKHFAELLDDLVVKPAGKPTLVSDADKRPAISSVASALRDFQGNQ